MRGFIDEWRSDFRTMKPVVIWAVLTVIVGFAGPFGTYLSIAMPKRLLLWALLVLSGILIGLSVRAFVVGTLKLTRFYDGALLTAGLTAVVLPPILTGIIRLVEPTVEPPSYDELAVFVFLVSLSAGAYRTGASYTERRQALSEKPPDPVPLTQAAPRLLERLPVAMRGQLISISVRDHYVDVLTDKGTSSLLMRLSDAIAETEPTKGAQIHRSHWVAWEFVHAFDKKSGRLLLTLDGAAWLPVSRPYRPLVEARGIGMARAEAPPHKMASARAPNSDDSATSSHQSPPV